MDRSTCNHFKMRALLSIIMRLWNEDGGQDISEYSLLLAFIFLISLCLFLQDGRDVAAIWGTVNSLAGQGANGGPKAAGNRLP
jgi:hypothetical protein